MPNRDVSALPAREQKIRLWGLVLWPSFMAACALEVLIFALVDPGDISWPGSWGQPSRRSVYTVAFFCFWAITIVSSRVVLWLTESDDEARTPVTNKTVG